ncbi:MAG: monovalent cation/H(+) antiporter subunit G [Microcella sp.]|uniref:cation:proton antiporter n=1 Tax=Microcella sp. TaxID=1913979 RepID=UPI0024CD1858|nr:monovalent cation/H(+) antiporter subunit G [Microcella sp.]UYN84169.1 MAG: monovalent cation/H(+) antiporter subunit G [Microcella sp.]
MNAELVVSVIGNGFLVLGAVIIASAAIGIIKLPDLYTRTSAIGTAAGLGVALIIVGVVTLDFSVLNFIKGIIAIIAQVLTSAVGSFALARSGYLTGSRPVATTVPDELADSADHDAIDAQRALRDIEGDSPTHET